MDVPNSKAELMEWIERDWSALNEALDPLSPQQMRTPGEGGWSAKDHVAHLAVWEQVLLRHHMGGESFDEAMGVDVEEGVELSIDEENELLFKKHQQRDAAELVAELRASHAEILATLNGMSYEDLMQPRHPERPEDGPLIRWVAGDTYEHYQEHLEAIRGAGGVS